MTEALRVAERGRVLEFTFEDMLRYHGPGSPAGVAMAFQVLRRAFAELSPDAVPDRRSVVVRTAFRGPGARDGIEAVTRAVSDGRYTVDRTLVRTDLGILREDFVFEVGLADRNVTVVLRDGFVTPEFIDLARAEIRTASQESRFEALKAAVARKVISKSAGEVYDIAR